MAANTTPIFGLTPKTAGTQFANADGTTLKTIYTAGASGARVLSVGAVTTDTSANDVTLNVQPGGAGTVYPIGGTRVAANSGTGANPTAAVNVLGSTQLPQLLPDGSLQLAANDVLQAGVVAAVTATKTLTLLVQAIDY